MGVPEIAFWTAIAVVTYVYAGYPVLLVGLSAVFRRPPQKRPIEPSVSLLVAAYNEADVIEAKVRNALDRTIRPTGCKSPLPQTDPKMGRPNWPAPPPGVTRA